MKEPKTMTLGELKLKLQWLWDLDDNTEITIGQGDLSLYRAKTHLYKSDNRTPALINLEFNELYKVTVDPDDVA
jgi:hypothetical protein